MRVIFILPGRGGGGGAHSVIQESMGLQRLGVRVDIATTRDTLAAFSFNYPELERSRIVVHAFDEPGEISELAGRCDIVCATTWQSVHIVAEALGPKPKVRTAYYVQDYEPLFCAPGSPEWERSRRSYVEIADAMMFAKTDFLCDIVTRNHQRPVARVRASIDHETYFPGAAGAPGKLTVSAMLRPKTPRRAPRRHARVLEMLAEAYGDRIDILTFGCAREELAAAGLRLSDRIRHHGTLSRKEVAGVLRASDLFLDLSDYQAFGRTGLEGMACGCVPVLPIFGGAGEYVRHWRNGFLVDPRSDQEVMKVAAAYLELAEEPRRRMRHAAIETALDYTVDKAAFSEFTLFGEMLA